MHGNGVLTFFSHLFALVDGLEGGFGLEHAGGLPVTAEVESACLDELIPIHERRV